MSDKAVKTEYRVKRGELSGLRLALVADLHERNADDIAELLENAKPDIIAVAGDTLERYYGDKRSESAGEKFNIIRWLVINIAYYFNELLGLFTRGRNLPDDENSFRFLERAAGVAPVFMSLGNHEEKLNSEDYKRLCYLGIHLLDNSDEVIYLKGKKLRIGGLSSEPDLDWLGSYAKKDGFRLLLCHHPEYFVRFAGNESADFVLSGHAHGGQVRIGGRGIISPGQGFLPKYTKGIYENRLAVSAGCSNPVNVPRINNPRELVIIDFE